MVLIKARLHCRAWHPRAPLGQARVQCKKSKVTAVTRFIRWNQSRERLSKGPAKGQTGWISEEGGLVKSIRWPDLPNELRYMVSPEMTRRVKQPTKFQQSDCPVWFGPVEGGVASSHWTSHYI